LFKGQEQKNKCLSLKQLNLMLESLFLQTELYCRVWLKS